MASLSHLRWSICAWQRRLRYRASCGSGAGHRVSGAAPVAQWIERMASDHQVAGSNPAGRALTLSTVTVSGRAQSQPEAEGVGSEVDSRESVARSLRSARRSHAVALHDARRPMRSIVRGDCAGTPRRSRGRRLTIRASRVSPVAPPCARGTSRPPPRRRHERARSRLCFSRRTGIESLVLEFRHPEAHGRRARSSRHRA